MAAYLERAAVERLRIEHACLHVLVAQQLLNGADLLAPLQPCCNPPRTAVDRSRRQNGCRSSIPHATPPSSRPCGYGPAARCGGACGGSTAVGGPVPIDCAQGSTDPPASAHSTRPGSWQKCHGLSICRRCHLRQGRLSDQALRRGQQFISIAAHQPLIALAESPAANPVAESSAANP